MVEIDVILATSHGPNQDSEEQRRASAPAMKEQ